MRINTITSNYTDRRTNIQTNTVKKWRTPQINYNKQTNFDSISFSGGIADEIRLGNELLEKMISLETQGLQYRDYALKMVNEVRLKISDILKANGFYQNSLFTQMKEGSHAYNRFNFILNNSAEREEGSYMGGISDIIALKCETHPDAVLKIKKSRRQWAWGHNTITSPTTFQFEDKNIKLNEPHAHLTTEDGTELYFGFRFPEKGEEINHKVLFNQEVKTLSSDRPYFLSTEDDNIVYRIQDIKNNIIYAFKYENGSDNLVGIRLDDGTKYEKGIGIIKAKDHSDLFTASKIVLGDGTAHLEKVYL